MLINPASRPGRMLHWIFEMSLVIKGLLAGGEALGGFGLWLTPNITLLKFVGWLTRQHLTQNPSEEMAVFVKHLADAFPVGVQHFWAIYMLAHGTLKFTMVLMLAWRILWAYPIAMLILAGFVVYQMTEYYLHGGLALVALSSFDSFMIVLVWREYNIMRLERDLRRHAASAVREAK